MTALNLQSNLFGGGDFVHRLHSEAPDNRVWIASNHGGEWYQRPHDLAGAVEAAAFMALVECDDCYVTANGFSHRGARAVSDVVSINSLFIDFDRYKTEYADLPLIEFIELVMRENPELPPPSLVMDSGNGCWAFWQFTKPLMLGKRTAKHGFLPQWQACQQVLVEKLAKYGADPVSADAARVVRLAGTINSKTGKLAQAWEAGRRYDFLGELKPILASKPEKPPQMPLVGKANRGNVASFSGRYTFLTLADDRKASIRKLAELRGGRLTDCRSRAIWAYMVESAHFCFDEHSLIAETETFIDRYITDPGRYKRGLRSNCATVIKRYRAERELRLQGSTKKQAREELGFEGRQYTFTRNYLANLLDVTPEEGEQLKAIFDQGEKRRRDQLRKERERRSKGMGLLTDHNQGQASKAAERAFQARQMVQDGMSINEVSRALGVTRQTVTRYLKG